MLLAILLGAGVARAADTPSTALSAVGDLASLLEGEFTTERSASDGSGTGPRGQTYYEMAKRVDVPAIGHDVVYAELRRDGPEGPIVRQRLYGLTLDNDSGRIRMTAYSFANAGQLAGAQADRTPLAKLAPAQLKPEGCAIDWRVVENGFQGNVRPLSCPAAPKSASTTDTPVMAVSKTGLSMPIEPADLNAPTAFRRLR